MKISGEEQNRLAEAYVFATQAHEGQARKGTDLPYATHPIRVALQLRDVNAPLDCQIAGALHDVVEDTDIGLDVIEKRFGVNVASIVGCLTKPAGEKLSPAAVAERLESQEALLVKAADLFVNMLDTVEAGDLHGIFRNPDRTVQGYLDLAGLLIQRLHVDQDPAAQTMRMRLEEVMLLMRYKMITPGTAAGSR